MKTISFVAFLFVFTTVARAQITSTSSAEDCETFIADVLNSTKAAYRRTYTFNFNRGELSILEEEEEDLTKRIYKGINWVDFTEDIPMFHIGDKTISIDFFFTSEHILEEEIIIDKKSNIIKERKLKDKPRNFIYVGTFASSPESIEKLKGLEVAVKRLHTIYKEKGNIVQTTATPKKYKNIDGKPSYEETLKFINSFLSDIQSNEFFCNGKRFNNKHARVGEDANRGYIKLFSSYVSYYQKEETNQVYKIDMSKIVEIKVVRGMGFEGGCCQFGLWFIEEGKTGKPVMHLPLWNSSYSKKNDEFKDEKIYKAFEHLRKLSGAPDPISFD